MRQSTANKAANGPKAKQSESASTEHTKMIVLAKCSTRSKMMNKPRALSGLMRYVYHSLAVLSILSCAAHAATLLPNGKQQFTDQNGAPYAGGTVCFYIPSTTTPKTTWQDALETTPNTSPCVTLDSAGRAVVYGTGQYREQLFDASSNLIWDQLTQDSPTLTPLYYGSTSTGTANAQAISLVGAMQPAALTTGQFYEFIAGFTNTGAATLAITTSQTTFTALNVYKQGASGPTALTGGEVVAGNVVTVIYDGTQFQLLNNPTPTTGAIVPSQLPFNEVTTSSNVTSPTSLTGYVASAAITIDLPLTTSVTKAYQLFVFGQGGAITLSPNAADKIQGGSTGVNFVVASGTSAMIVTDASGNWWLFYTGSAGGGGTAGAVQQQTFTTSGTFTAPATTNYRFYVTGGGGGGAGAHSGGGGGGGGAGGTSSYLVLVTAGSSVTVTIGGGGNGGPSATAGSAGVASSIVVNGVTITSNGGAGGGLGATASVPGTNGIGYASGGDGGTGGTPTATAIGGAQGGSGQGGGMGLCQYWGSTCAQGAAGDGGASFWGGGGRGEAAYDGTNAVGAAGAGVACGSGGGGATKGTDSGAAGAGGCATVQWVQ